MLKLIAPAVVLMATVGSAHAQRYSSPPGGDTTGYWQQQVAYTIVATLDEEAQRVRARGTMRYVNHSPDTLREMYVHQYLNAFRPHSLWARRDERMAVDRFQHLRDPDFAYERFTAPVRVNGQAVRVTYPGAPDSTVARFSLPSPLPPGDSVVVRFEWDARPSTLPRRQGRRGRHWDLAQWYPKVAVYDRDGWRPNALQPAGEFYGEFGTYDVTLVVREDQVVGATGVPVAGDPGWARAARAGVAPLQRGAYGAAPPAPIANVPAGYKAVRFHARDVHHFGWSASPFYRYEGGTYVRQVPPGDSRSHRWRTWDTVAIHVLYRPGDDTTWGGTRVVQRTINALQWLETIYGEYAYPQMTVLHRIEGGGTEFPMMQMNGSPSQGLILHEGGHVYTYGILANNEWRSGWMDEGLTSYQSEWAQGLTPQERRREGIADRFVAARGYRARAITPRMSRFDAIGLSQAMADMNGEAEPIGTTAHHFRDFSTYNDMIYTRAQVMYGQLRDAIGDTSFLAFLREYHERWALRHVDEPAMRSAAEAAHGRDLGWFFEQWVHRTGVMDYALESARWAPRSDSGWITEARVRRRGRYSHPIAVGVRTQAGWASWPLPDPTAGEQVVRVPSAMEPLEVRLDPHHFSWDWDRRNDVLRTAPRVNFDWPLLRQSDRERSVVLARPAAWYGDPGGINAGLRIRSSYLGVVDRRELGAVYAARPGIPASSAIQYWAGLENPYLPFRSRPLMGWSTGVARLDDVLKAAVAYRRERVVGAFSERTTLALAYTDPLAATLLPDGWEDQRVADVSWRSRVRRDLAGGGYWLSDGGLVLGVDADAFAKFELSTARVFEATQRSTFGVRTFVGFALGAPVAQRALRVSSRDPVETFANHWWRPRGGILKQRDVQWLPLGGAGLRGYRWDLVADHLIATNLDLATRIAAVRGSAVSLEFRVHAFADAGNRNPGFDEPWLADAGAGVSVRGRVFDRDVHLRLDAPVYLSQPALAVDRRAGLSKVAARWVLSAEELW